MKAPFDLYHDPLMQGIHAIEASAGTGKTYTLAQLVVRLVVEKGMPIERILVVTFTRAAAAELRERIFARLSEVLQALDKGSLQDKSLQDWVDQLHDKTDARKAILRAYLMLDRAPIYTIDAFAMQVVKEHAPSLGLSWDATLVEDKGRLDQQIIDSLWHQLDELPVQMRHMMLSRWASPDELFERVEKLGIGATFAEDLSAWQPLWQRYEAVHTKWTKERLQAIGAALDTVRHGCNPKSLKKCARMILDPLKAGQLPRMEDDTPLDQYLKRSLTKKSPYDSLPQAIRDEMAALAHDVQYLITAEETLVQSWFKDLYTQWQTLRQQKLQQQGLFTYDNLKRLLADAVSSQGELCQQLRQQYQACLIDEFQDTDPDQWRLFSTLFGNGDTHWLFLIGDPKQAIYSFRGANLLTYFAAVKAARFHHTLDTNYRSHPKLIEGFNQLFAEVADENTFLSEDCLYQPVNSGRKADELAFTLAGQPMETIRIVRGQGLADMEEATCQQLARDVVRVLKAGQLQQQPVKPGHIAVLVKNNTDALRVQKALRQVKVPSVLTSKTSVWHSDSAKALLQLLQAILHPRQRAHVRAVLAGPYFQYTLSDLDDEARYAAAQLMLSTALQRWQQEDVLSALLHLFQQAQVWHRLARLPDGDRRMADTRHLLELLQSQAHQQQGSPQALMRWAIHQHQQAADEHHTLRLEKDDDAVEIVTMHSAKGLEYPIVFIYGAWRGGVVRSQKYPLAKPTPYGKKACFSKEDKDELIAQEQQELRRLFYVACTRAISHLTIYWPNADKAQKYWPDALNGILRPRLSALCASALFRFDDYEDKSAPLSAWIPQQADAPLVAPPEIDFSALRQRCRLLTSYSGLIRHGGAESPYERWEEEADSTPAEMNDPLPAGAAFGKLMHDFLQQTDFAQPDWAWLKDKWQRFSNNWEEKWPTLQALVEQTLAGDCQPFRLKDLPTHAVRKEYHFVLHAPKLQVDQLNALFKDRPDWSPVDRRSVHGFLQGYIDLIVEAGERYYIVDYKTNRLPAYDQQTLATAMAAHHYTLQGLIYTLALDAHLRAFKPDYDPAHHLGGVRYLFMRGMRPDSTEGVYAFHFTRQQLDQVRNMLMGDAP
ncbi:MAG TPA: hypothetical protein EYH46_03965 [Sulfurivirga caldicuralii]|nr:hypothetical protein [Sulfurivirga caldicuralii]